MSISAKVTARAASLDTVRAAIAREVLDAHRAPLSLGDIVLHPHQRGAVVRISTLLAVHGGALLADATGLGKTYVALAAARDVERVLIICPAGLRESWRRALLRIGWTAGILSLERLSRGVPDLNDRPELVVIDESHHLRNPKTRRYDAAASLCDRARVLLLSATPVQNRREDLVAQLALFLGDAALPMTDIELARFVVRRDVGESAARLPALVGPRWISLDVDDDVLDEIVALPPPVPLAGEGDAHALLQYGLLRQWSSSRAALIAGLRGRLARGVALIAALETGRRPTPHELAAWSRTDDSVQLGMPELLVSSGAEGIDNGELLEAARQHVDAVGALLGRLRRMQDPDPARAEALRSLRRRHEGERLIAFSQYAETVRALSRLLTTRDAGVAELTARGGRVAGGRIAREEVLAQFSPPAVDVARAERIDLLVTTDVSSEGLDLQMASVIVHLDLPWNPARLEQRVGRARRLGGRLDRVFVYALAPPARSEHVLEVEARLRAKLRVAARVVGIGSASLPDVDLEPGDAAPPLMSDIYAVLERWQCGASPSVPDGDGPLCAAVNSASAGYLGLLADGHDRFLVADVGDGPTMDARVVRQLTSLGQGIGIAARGADVAAAVTAMERWWEQRVAREAIRVLSADGRRIRARIAARIAAILARTPRYARAALAPDAAAASRTLGVPLGMGAERVLATLAAAEGDDEEWLAQVAGLGVGRAGPHVRRAPRIVALIVLQPDGR